VKAISRQGTNKPLGDLLRQFNLVLRGWTTYFRHGVSAATFGYLRHYAWSRVVAWLRHKHRHAGWKLLRRRYLIGTGWWPEQDGVTLFNPAAVRITRYRYRRDRIPSPWAERTALVSAVPEGLLLYSPLNPVGRVLGQVRSTRGAVPASRRVRFPGPPPEPRTCASPRKGSGAARCRLYEVEWGDRPRIRVVPGSVPGDAAVQRRRTDVPVDRQPGPRCAPSSGSSGGEPRRVWADLHWQDVPARRTQG
jgi:hypothetical protein